MKRRTFLKFLVATGATAASGLRLIKAVAEPSVAALVARWDGFYTGMWLVIANGKGAGQVRTIVGYNGTTRVATLSAPWKEAPDSTSAFAIINPASTDGRSI